jgi:hypothetical protein
MVADTFDAPLVIADSEGRKYINAEKLGENYFVIRADDYPLSVGPSTKALTGFGIPEDAGHAGDFEAAGIVGYGTAPFLLTLQEVGIEASSFMSNPVHGDLCSGMGGLPLVLPETMFFIAGRFVQVEVTNLSTTLTNSVRLALVGRKFNSEMKPEVRERRSGFLSSRPTRSFWLTLDRTKAQIAANSTNQEFFLTMPSGSHFVAESIMAESTGIFEFAMFDAQSGRALTYGNSGTGFIDSRMLTGPGGLPSKTFGSPILQPRRAIRVLFNDLSGATNNIYFTLLGRRMRMPVG